MPKKRLTQADLDLLKARGKITNGFHTERDMPYTFDKPVWGDPVWKTSKIEIKVTNTDTELKRMVREKVKECYAMANKFQPLKSFRKPKIEFKKRGKTAGTAHYGLIIKLNFNMVLLRENTEHFIDNTVPHECAHLIARTIFGIKITPHGKEWKRVMVKLGVNPKRCHSYSVSNSTVYEKAKHLYKCKCQYHAIGPVRHKKMVMLNSSIYKCRICKAALVFHKSVGRVSKEQALSMV